MRLVIVLVLTTFAANLSQAATITVASLDSGGVPLIMIEGDLGPGDAAQFNQKTASLKGAIISFNSDGGNLLAGLQIGETIRLRQFYTVVPKRMRCASACALAWLGGVQRFMFEDGKIGFHAAYDSTSGKETGVGNALVGAYLTKIGLSYDAVIYITQAAPNEMTWLNISDAARHGIKVMLLSPVATETQVTVPTRFGTIIVTRDADQCCIGYIKYAMQEMRIVSAGYIYASLEGVYQVGEGDLVIIKTPSGARGLPDTYYLLLATHAGMTDVTPSDFVPWDYTFRVTQRGNDIYFDLGFDKKRKKDAVYKKGVAHVTFTSPTTNATLPKNECASLLNMVAKCSEIRDCSGEGIGDEFGMAGQRYFNALENMPVFTSDNFYRVCTSVCQTKSYNARESRSILCGY
jgi:hypothetical protein